MWSNGSAAAQYPSEGIAVSVDPDQTGLLLSCPQKIALPAGTELLPVEPMELLSTFAWRKKAARECSGCIADMRACTVTTAAHGIAWTSPQWQSVVKPASCLVYRPVSYMNMPRLQCRYSPKVVVLLVCGLHT